ncbi:hypothetical protein [Treponema denticola]|uniref:hypothetical protein n=1 Tax=Treponema denticola TaxID=158 RepID=UPI002103602C|nr:hypothetical protein [Treponema denticola]UTY23706.1 hypothetical protein E4N78_05880 [Treponema denticola]
MIKKIRDELLQTVSHLSNNEIQSMRTDYFSAMKSTELKKKYKITSYKFSLGKCHYVFPLKETKEICPNCGEKLFLLENPRDDLRSSNDNVLFCEACDHEETSSCDCNFCTEIRKDLKKIELERKRKFIYERIDFDNFVPISLKKLTYREKFLLGTLIQAGIEDDFKTLKPFSACSMQIFPSDEELNSVLNELKLKHLLEFSPRSQLNWFEPDYENNNFQYYWKNVQFQINIKEIDENPTITREFLNPQDWMLSYPKNDPTIWEEIVYWEALSLFNYILDYFNISYEIGKETEVFFWTVTKQLPLAVVYSIIYQSGKNIAAYSRTNQCPKYIAYNSILQNMRSKRDKIIAGQFQRWEYNRPDKECPQSIVSQYYFNTILKICENYWKMLPLDFFSIEK